MIRKSKYIKNMLKGVTFIDLFAGIGAFRTALESFGAKCVFSCEWDEDAQDTYEANYGERPAGDITKIAESDIPGHDILCAGIPCQPFSISGKRLGFADTRGTLFFEVARIVKYHQPKVVIIENVKNFVVHDGGRTFGVIMNTMDELGYVVYHKVLNATDYGVPQKRERVYIVCVRKDLDNSQFVFPNPIPLKKHLCNLLLPDDETDAYVIDRDDIVLRKRIPKRYSNTPLRIGMINKGGQGERIYSPRGVSITLSAYGGGVGAKTGLYLINNRIRRLAPRECARLDGFRDKFKIPNNRNIAYKQFGNSIVVDVLQYIILQLVITEGQLFNVD